MISVRVITRKGKIIRVSLSGHGGGEYGKDLVCAGASAIADVSEYDEVVLETLVTQLKTISESYPKNLCLTLSRKEG